MKLNKIIIEEIAKKLQTGCPAKYAAQAEGIAESTFYKWKADGELILERVTDKDGERIEEEWEKLNETEKLKSEFSESIRTSIAQGHVVLVASIYSQIKDGWKAAMEILSRRFPSEWAKKDYLHVDQEISKSPDKLKEIEDDIFEGIPESKRGDVIKSMAEAIEGARNGKPEGSSEGKSKTAS